MKLKFYFELINDLPEIIMGQNTENYNYDSVNFKFSDNVELKDKTSTFLAEVNTDTNEIISIVNEVNKTVYAPTKKQVKEVKDHNEKIVRGEKTKNIQTLKIPDDVAIDETVWNLIVTCLKEKLYPCLLGPKGCGKTTIFYALARELGVSFYPINCGSIFKPKETLKSSLQARDGSTFIVNSEFLDHFSSDKPTLIYLDEITRTPPGAANVMLTALDRKQNYMYIEDLGKRVYKGKNVTFAGSANYGSEYTDTRNQDGAFLDRFIKYIIDFLPAEKEIQLIQKKVPGVNVIDIQNLVSIANKLREQAGEDGELKTVISTRQLIDMCSIMKNGHDFRDIIDYNLISCFVNGNLDEREIVRGILKSIL